MNQTLKIILIGLGIGALAFLGLFIVARFAKNRHSSEGTVQATLSGQIDLNGYVPANSYIKVQVKNLPNGDFVTAVDSIAARNGATWSYGSAAAGETYQVQAMLVVGNSVTDTSKSVLAVAPEQNIVLSINSSNQPETNDNAPAEISGTINLNGFVPQGSSISIAAQKSGDSNFQTVVTGVSAKDGATWSWNSAETGETYKIRASLVGGTGTNITTTAPQEVTAPATDELITLNSTATPPTPSAVTISGNVTFNGNMPPNPTFSLGVRKTGTASFNNTTSGASVSQNMAWAYNNAVPGVSYDIQGYLWSNNQPYSQSQILTVTAPATSEVLTINAQIQPPAPGAGTINVSCGSQQNNLYQVTVNFNTQNNLPNAQQYQVTIGSTSGASDMFNSTVSPSNPNSSQSLTTNFLFSRAVNYFAQYAYSTCQGGSCSTFSQFSPSAGFNCQ